jgi:SM-20-related protein
MRAIQDAVARHGPALCEAVRSRGWGLVDGFLSKEAIAGMRAEAEGLLAQGELRPSESTRWDEAQGAAVRYPKKNVLYTNIEGGARYEQAPMLTEYCVSLVSSLPAACNQHIFGGAPTLRSDVHTNKLAVCLGDGSKYDKHYDNMGGGDMRKLTVLFYLQDEWSERMGGCFRIHAASDGRVPSPGKAAAGDVAIHDPSDGRAAGPGGIAMAGVAGTGEGVVEPREAATAAGVAVTSKAVAGVAALGEGVAGLTGTGEGGTSAARLGEVVVDIEPLGGRLLCFWSDTLVHSVCESFASGGAAEHRWALTVWVHAAREGDIVFDGEAEQRHFGSGGEGQA